MLFRKPRCLVFRLDELDFWQALKIRRGFSPEDTLLEEIRTSGEVAVNDHILIVSEKPPMASEWLLRQEEGRKWEWVRIPIRYAPTRTNGSGIRGGLSK